MDWSAVDKVVSSAGNGDDQSRKNCLEILSDMIDPLHDATHFHQRQFHQTEISWLSACPDPSRRTMRRVSRDIEKQYMHGDCEDFCNKQLQFGMLNSSVAYIRIHSFSSYSEDKEFANN